MTVATTRQMPPMGGEISSIRRYRFFQSADVKTFNQPRLILCRWPVFSPTKTGDAIFTYPDVNYRLHIIEVRQTIEFEEWRVEPAPS